MPSVHSGATRLVALEAGGCVRRGLRPSPAGLPARDRLLRLPASPAFPDPGLWPPRPARAVSARALAPGSCCTVFSFWMTAHWLKRACTLGTSPIGARRCTASAAKPAPDHAAQPAVDMPDGQASASKYRLRIAGSKVRFLSPGRGRRRFVIAAGAGFLKTGQTRFANVSSALK